MLHQAGGRWTPVEPLRGWGFTTYNALLGEAFLRGLFASYALQQTHHPEPPALPSSQAFRVEGPFSRYVRGLA